MQTPHTDVQSQVSSVWISFVLTAVFRSGIWPLSPASRRWWPPAEEGSSASSTFGLGTSGSSTSTTRRTSTSTAWLGPALRWAISWPHAPIQGRSDSSTRRENSPSTAGVPLHNLPTRSRSPSMPFSSTQRRRPGCSQPPRSVESSQVDWLILAAVRTA